MNPELFNPAILEQGLNGGLALDIVGSAAIVGTALALYFVVSKGLYNAITGKQRPPKKTRHHNPTI